MLIRTSKSLYFEVIVSLVLCGMVLFAFGLFVSQQFADQGPMQWMLIASSVIGGLVLFANVGRSRRRFSIVKTLEEQLSAAAHCPEGEQSVAPKLHPIVGHSFISEGWNRVVHLVNDRALDQGIERRLQQSSSNRNTERFARAIRSLSEGIAITDEHGRISYANPAWASLLGSDIEQDLTVVGKSIEECLQSIVSTNWNEVQPKLLVGTRPFSIFLNRGNAVQDGVLQISRLLLDGRSNEPEGFVWTLKDVTQSALAREAHEQFLASATHELRTPLTNIRAYTESLLEIKDISAEQQQEFFNVIHSEAGRLGRLLNQLLDIQQLEAGSMTVHLHAFDVQRMAEEVQEHIGPLVNEKKLRLTCRIAPNLKTIHADKEKITSCLINLLGNAVKYTPAGGEVRLIVERLDTHISLSVEDNGIGISEEELPKIFQRFYRCQDERVHDIEGNGLGLSFCMEVARLHGGDLHAESELDKGSRFVLRIPFSENS